MSVPDAYADGGFVEQRTKLMMTLSDVLFKWDGNRRLLDSGTENVCGRKPG